MSANPSSGFKRIILFSERERLDVQYIPKINRAKHPQGFKYSFNYRVFLKGRWIALVRWDNSHQGCHIDLHGAQEKHLDEKRARMQLFEEISDSIADDLQQVRSTVRSAVDNDDVESIDYLLKNIVKNQYDGLK